MTFPQIETTPQWQNYLDLNNDVKPYLQFPTGAAPTDAQMQDVIDAACWWAQDTLGRPLAPTQFARRFDGYSGFGGSRIDLPYYPVLGVPTVTEYWGSSGPHVLTLQTPEAQGGSDMYQLDAIRGIITRSFLGLMQRPFFPGLKNVEVTWTAGFNPIPRHWLLATKELVKWWWSNTQQASRSFHGGGPQAYDEVPVNGSLWPAIPDRIAVMFETGQQIGIG